MRNVIVMLLILSVAGSAIAIDLGSKKEVPIKTTPIINYVSPSNTLQGGDNIATAMPIVSLPFIDAGTTFGYFNDYDVACTFTGSTSPDVVYSYTPTTDVMLTVDLCGSAYDTKTYIYDMNMLVVACNDDFYFDAVCGTYVSKIEGAPLMGGMTYYIVIDGYGGDSGLYQLDITETTPAEPCIVTCSVDAMPEGEPTLINGIDDEYNSGCNGTLGNFMVINWTNDADGLPPYDGSSWLCGKSGWITDSLGGDTRDTDWFSVTALSTGMMDVMVDSEEPCFLFKISPTDCLTMVIELISESACGLPATLSFPVVAGEVVWLWVGPTVFIPPVGAVRPVEFNYFMTVSNNTFDIIPNEETSWGSIKTMFR